MTLIVGTTHWNGICLNADTRGTNKKKKTYFDGIQKASHVHGGIGMVAAGDGLSAKIFREVYRNTLEEVAKSGIKYNKNIDLIPITQDIIYKALKNVINHPVIQIRPVYEIQTQGLIGVNISDQRLTLDKKEAENLIEILCNTSKINDVYTKHIKDITACARGEIEKVIFEEFYQSVLFTYKLKLFDDKDASIYEVKRVPFGKIVALGSGSKFNYLEKSPRILSWILFGCDGIDIETATLHLAQIQAYADMEIERDIDFKFKTFGGATIPVVIKTDKNNIGFTNVILGDLISKKDRSLISSTFEKNGKLWVKTKENKEIKLETFPDKVDIEKFSLCC